VDVNDLGLPRAGAGVCLKGGRDGRAATATATATAVRTLGRCSQGRKRRQRKKRTEDEKWKCAYLSMGGCKVEGGEGVGGRQTESRAWSWEESEGKGGVRLGRVGW